MKSEKSFEDRFRFRLPGSETTGSAENIVFVGIIGLICLYLWLMISLWIE